MTVGPGLSGSLLVGLNTAKAIAFARDLPLVAVSHLEAHIYANWLDVDGSGAAPPSCFPLLVLIVSGGHSDLLVMEEHGRYRPLGSTRDDAAGEAFDKVARLLGLGFPGGPAVERAARGVPVRAELSATPAARLCCAGRYDFSFSGLKTAVLRRRAGVRRGRAEGGDCGRFPGIGRGGARRQDRAGRPRGEGAARYWCPAASPRTRRSGKPLTKRAPVPVRLPPPILCTDNAAMVAACGYFRFRRGERAGLDQDVLSGLGLPPS